MLSAALTSPLLLLGVILFVGAMLGEGAERLGAPWITGCILAGALLGPDATGALPRSALPALGGFLQASLAVIAFNIGSRLTFTRLRTIGTSVAWLTLAQLLAPLAAVFGAETLIGMQRPTALIVAAVAPVTAPTVTYAMIRRRNASGPFVDRALGILAINDAATIIIFSVVSSATIAILGAQSSGAAVDVSVRVAAADEALSLLLGAALGAAYLIALRTISSGCPGSEGRLRAMLYALLLTAAAAAVAFGLSHLLGPLAMGVVIAAGSSEAERTQVQNAVADIEDPLYVIFFVLAGARLPIADVASGFMALAAAIYVLARFASKYAAIYGIAFALRLDASTRRYLGLCFPAQGGTAMGLVLACATSPAARALPKSGAVMVETAISVVLVGVLLSGILGPFVIDQGVRRGCAAEAQSSAGRVRETAS